MRIERAGAIPTARRPWRALLRTALGGALACAAPAALLAQRAVVVDTDAGADDLMAIAFLLASPAVRVEAVCVGVGLAHVPAGAANVLRLLELAGRGDVPVYMGRGTPLAPAREFPAEWRRVSDALPGVTLPRARRAPESRPARDYLAGRLRDARRPVDVLALGGLTNVAEALDAGPGAARALRRLVIMGGALRVPGNLADGGVTANTTAEWNFHVDPEAARRVLASGVPIRLVPLDATRRVPIDAAFVRAVEGAARSPLAGAVAQVLGTVRDDIARGHYYAWDTLAAAALVEPSVVRFAPAAVRVRTRAPEEGRTVEVPGEAPNAEVGLDADGGRFRALFLRTLAGGRGRAAAPGRP